MKNKIKKVLYFNNALSVYLKKNCRDLDFLDKTDVKILKENFENLNSVFNDFISYCEEQIKQKDVEDARKLAEQMNEDNRIKKQQEKEKLDCAFEELNNIFSELFT